ncbi:MAG: hypothetical protein II453_10515 [Alphaproteobacteria bacterium]|nr:hypothetical protein [Alphaproteobacteria bacterium]MBQ3945988.1 hypothetical protein [Alphaproteobacteria bacterium]
MKLEEYYTIGELLLNETSNTKQEFKPKIGDGVESSNKKEQEKAVRDITKNAEKLDDEGRKDEKPVKPSVEFPDYNKTTLDANFEYDPGKDWKDRVEAQAQGYPSVQNREKNGYDQSLDFEGNKKFYDARKEMSNDRNDLDTIERESGLKARIKKDEIDYSNKTPFNEARQIKRLKFKNTIFLSESHLLSKVPEDYRVNENRFYMQDKTGTDYLIECKADPFGYVHMQVVNKFNKQVINEELEKMKKLAGYRYSDDNKKVDTGKMETMSESISNFREKLNN